jgi:DNA-binding NtrC family response regulator
MQRRILIAEDSLQTQEQLRQLLEADSFLKVDSCGDGRSALKALEQHPYSFLITDLRMPDMDGMRLLKEIRKQQLPVTVIFLTGHGSIDKAVEAMRLGAYDFLTKPVDVEHLRLLLDRAARERRLLDEVIELRQQLEEQHRFHAILSKSPTMHAIFELIQTIASTTATVLIEGETGTGKELIARAIHEASQPGRAGPLIALHCAALPENLLESELFGHEKGAFTGAVGLRKGRFELADGGTLFLDEVGEIPPAMQVKLLRVLQERSFERVGGAESIEVDVRVVAATNANLLEQVKLGKFREDLYYRLNVVKMALPPLRERTEDIPLLATHFATKYARPGEPPKQISPAAMEQLLRHRWPGNIRELENLVERACVTARGPCLEPEDLSLQPVQDFAPTPPGGPDLTRPLPKLVEEATAALEEKFLRRAMKEARGNVGRCARICGLSRRSVTAKLSLYGIDKVSFKD